MCFSCRIHEFWLKSWFRFTDSGWKHVKEHDIDEQDTSEHKESSDTKTDDEIDIPQLEAFQTGRDRIETKLRQPIFIQKYPGRAGEITDNPAEAGNYGYNGYTWTENVYAPFAHRLDWEIARWCQLRGPGSTAVSELLGINGVSHFYFSINLF